MTRRLLRAITFHHSDLPSFIGVQWRIESPPPGNSTLITSAPKSASWVAASGPAIIVPASITRSPFKGPCSAAFGSVNAALACAVMSVSSVLSCFDEVGRLGA